MLSYNRLLIINKHHSNKLTLYYILVIFYFCYFLSNFFCKFSNHNHKLNLNNIQGFILKRPGHRFHYDLKKITTSLMYSDFFSTKY